MNLREIVSLREIGGPTRNDEPTRNGELTRNDGPTRNSELDENYDSKTIGNTIVLMKRNTAFLYYESIAIKFRLDTMHSITEMTDLNGRARNKVRRLQRPKSKY